MTEYDNLDKRMSLLEQKLDLVLNNHLHHIEKDMNMVKKFLGVTVLTVFAQLFAIIITFL